MGTGVEIGATVASKRAAFIIENVTGLLLFPRGVTRRPGGWLVRFWARGWLLRGGGSPPVWAGGVQVRKAPACETRHRVGSWGGVRKAVCSEARCPELSVDSVEVLAVVSSEFEPKVGVVAEPSSCLEGPALQRHEMLV